MNCQESLVALLLAALLIILVLNLLQYMGWGYEPLASAVPTWFNVDPNATLRAGTSGVWTNDPATPNITRVVPVRTSRTSTRPVSSRRRRGRTPTYMY